jgi:hypothetical protein
MPQTSWTAVEPPEVRALRSRVCLCGSAELFDSVMNDLTGRQLTWTGANLGKFASPRLCSNSEVLTG